MVTIFVIFLLLFSKSHALFLPSNSSLPILDQILIAIAAKERWDPNGTIRVLDLDPTSVRFGASQRYEFSVRVGKTMLTMRFSDGVVSWRRPPRDWAGFGLGLEFQEDLEASIVAGLELEGPLDLRGEDGIGITLVLPALNVTHGGLRRILVGDGISIKVERAQHVTLSHPHDIGLSLNRRNLVKANPDSNLFCPLGIPCCGPLLSVQVVGSASIDAFRTRNFEGYVKTVFHSDDTIELLSEKCYSNGHFRQFPSWSFGSLSSKLLFIEKALRKFLGKSIFGGPAQLFKAKISASNLVKCKLEVERDITENDRKWKRVAAWRTRPVIERVWFELVARVEAGKGLKEMLVRKLPRPIMTVESSPWSNLMSNMSFTQIPSIVLPPEALTLDVNW